MLRGVRFGVERENAGVQGSNYEFMSQYRNQDTKPGRERLRHEVMGQIRSLMEESCKYDYVIRFFIVNGVKKTRADARP